MSRFNAAAPLLVLIVANALGFAGISWNRSGEATGVMSFHPCELEYFRSPVRSWAVKPRRYLTFRTVSQLVAPNILESLHGIRPDSDGDDKRRKRRAYVVLKQGGPEWQDFLYSHKEDIASRRILLPRSKLVFIDGGSDPEQLLKTYPADRSRAILAGYTWGSVRLQDESVQYRWQPISNRIAIESQYRDIVRAMLRPRIELVEDAREEAIRTGEDYVEPPCISTHRITIKWGRRFEPWISSIAEVSS